MSERLVVLVERAHRRGTHGEAAGRGRARRGPAARARPRAGPPRWPRRAAAARESSHESKAGAPRTPGPRAARPRARPRRPPRPRSRARARRRRRARRPRAVSTTGSPSSDPSSAERADGSRPGSTAAPAAGRRPRRRAARRAALRVGRPLGEEQVGEQRPALAAAEPVGLVAATLDAGPAEQPHDEAGGTDPPSVAGHRTVIRSAWHRPAPGGTSASRPGLRWSRRRHRAQECSLTREDLVGDEAVGLAVHRVGRLGVRRLDEAEDLPGALVDPVAQVADAVRPLGGEVGLVGGRDVARRDAALDGVESMNSAMCGVSSLVGRRSSPAGDTTEPGTRVTSRLTATPVANPLDPGRR